MHYSWTLFRGARGMEWTETVLLQIYFKVCLHLSSFICRSSILVDWKLICGWLKPLGSWLSWQVRLRQSLAQPWWFSFLVEDIHGLSDAFREKDAHLEMCKKYLFCLSCIFHWYEIKYHFTPMSKPKILIIDLFDQNKPVLFFLNQRTLLIYFSRFGIRTHLKVWN